MLLANTESLVRTEGTMHAVKYREILEVNPAEAVCRAHTERKSTSG